MKKIKKVRKLPGIKRVKHPARKKRVSGPGINESYGKIKFK
jgi:hypothetical protein